MVVVGANDDDDDDDGSVSVRGGVVGLEVEMEVGWEEEGVRLN